MVTEGRKDGQAEKQYTPLKLRFAGVYSKYEKDALKALEGVHFTKYALPVL